MKYSFDARFELARRLSATLQRSASNFSMPVRWSAINLYFSLPHVGISYSPFVSPRVVVAASDPRTQRI